MATLRRRSRLGLIDMGARTALACDRDRADVDQGRARRSRPLLGVERRDAAEGRDRASSWRRNREVFLFVDSTRGIDVQTKFEFYEMLRRLADDGAACVLYSSDTEELVGLCDRVAVFHDGVPALMLEGDEITQDAVVAASFAGRREADVRSDPASPGSARTRPAVLVARPVRRLPRSRHDASASIEALGITNAALPLALAAAGETFVILTNGIDLSIGSVITLVERHAAR